MSKILWVGDPHSRREDLDDIDLLQSRIAQVVGLTRPDFVLIAGDLHHYFSIVHAEVMWRWYGFLRSLRAQGVRVVILVGNHDLPDSRDLRQHSLLPYLSVAEVIDVPTVMGPILYVPYQDEPAVFVKICQDSPTKTVFCHQTFTGAVFENGFVTKDGVDENLLPQRWVISGHIHTPQEKGKVWYPGAPRWLTMSDANVDRHIWLLEFSEQGEPLGRTGFDTNRCRRIVHMIDTPETSAQIPDGNVRVVLDLRGPAAWIQERKKQVAGPGRTVRTFPTDQVVVRVKESDGVMVAASKYLEAFQPPNGTDKVTLVKMVQERIRGFV